MSEKILKVELQRNNNKAMSTWEIQEFIGKLISNYYKIDLVNEIAKMINNGISLENIFILDKSFDYKNRYSYLANTDKVSLNDEDGAKNFYHLGSPIGLLPSQEIIEMGTKMEILRVINNDLHNKQIKRLDKSKVNRILKLEFYKAIDEMKNSAFNIIKDNFKEEDEQKVYCKGIERKIDSKVIIIKNYKNVEKDINYLKEKIIKNNEFELNILERELYKKYFSLFSENLLKFDRPIVGIYNKDTREIQILCKSYIHKKSRDSKFLDLKKFTHNSPTFVEMFSGFAMAIPMIPMIKGIRQSFENDFADRQLTERESNLCSKLDNISDTLDEIINEFELNSVSKINNSTVNGQFSMIENELVKKMNTNLSEFDFNNKNINVTVVDFKNIKKKN